METETVSLCKHQEVPIIIRKRTVVKEEDCQGGPHLGLRRVHMQSRIRKARYIVTLGMQNCLLKTTGTASSTFSLVAINSAMSCDDY